MSSHHQKALFDAVKVLLDPIALCKFGAKELATNTQKRRIVWVPTQDDPKNFMSAQGLIGAFSELATIEVRDVDFEAAKWLQKALWTAILQAVRDPALEGLSVNLGQAVHGGDQDSKFGYVIEQSLSILFPLQAVDLTTYSAYLEREDTEITGSDFDTTGAVDGDQEIVLPNK